MRPTISMLLTISVLLLSAVAWGGEPVTRAVDAELGARVEIDNMAGSVTVIGWDRARVEATGRLGRNTARLEVSGDPAHVRVRVEALERGGDLGGTELEVRVPDSALVVVETVSAHISAEGLRGRLELESVSGMVRVAGFPSGLDVTTVSGRIELPAAPPGTRLESVSGSIEVGTADGDLDAETVSGSVRVGSGMLERAELASASGEVFVDTDLAGPGTVHLESMSGRVVLVVPADAVADFSLETFSGSIRSQLGPEPRPSRSRGPGEELHFSTGSGGPRVVLSSFSGTVELRTRTR